MSKKTELFDKLDAFLAERKEAAGEGYAKATREELQDLYDFVQELIALKYEANMHGDYPIRVDIFDQSKAWLPLYHPVSSNPSLEDLSRAVALYSSATGYLADQMKSHVINEG